MAPPHLFEGLENRRGLWTQTATIDWCEPNYVLSYYIAEFWNTLSNLAFIVPQLATYISLSKHKNFEFVFRSAYLGLILIGIGSICFHMTLTRSMQMFDETSMILVILHSFYLLCLIKYPNANKKYMATGLVCYGLAFFAFYVFLVDMPIFHHTVFALLVYSSAVICYKLKKTYEGDIKFWTTFITQHLAFGLWLIDKNYCEVLTSFREHNVPSFLRPFFQFHAMWHLLMGLSSYIFLCAIVKMRAWTKYKEKFELRYRFFCFWITLEKSQDVNEEKDLAQQDQLISRKMNMRRLISRQQLTDINQNRVTLDHESIL